MPHPAHPSPIPVVFVVSLYGSLAHVIVEFGTWTIVISFVAWLLVAPMLGGAFF